MSDTEQANTKTISSGAAWTDAERLAYLVVALENGGQVDAKLNTAPVPAGRSVTSCKKMILRLKNTYKDTIEAIKAGQPVSATLVDENGQLKTPKKRGPKPKVKGGEDGENEDGSPRTSPKRKAKADGDADGSPKKRSRKPKIEADAEAEIKAEVMDEDGLDNEI